MKLYTWDEMLRTSGIFRAARDNAGHFNGNDYRLHVFLVTDGVIQYGRGMFTTNVHPCWYVDQFVKVREDCSHEQFHEEVQNPTPYDDGTVSWDEMVAKPGIYQTASGLGVYIVGCTTPVLYVSKSGVGSIVIAAEDRKGRFRRLRNSSSLNDIIACMEKKN